jgi:protoheme IX farnesyltransferase
LATQENTQLIKPFSGPVGGSTLPGSGLVDAPISVQAPPAEKSWLAVYLDLFKARLTFLVLLTALAGFYLGSRAPMDLRLMFHAMAGTALLAAGASALNQLWEREHDGQMRRTRGRPLPSGRLEPRTVLFIGAGTSLLGLVYLTLAVNAATAMIGAVTLASYLFVYTPLKRLSWWNTAVGAIPGGLPPLMGWVAARGHISPEALALFGILAFWQIPHFMAIAWLYRDEYARAGFRMLPVLDPSGRRTGRQAVAHTLVLLPLSLAPFLLRLAGPVYLAGAATLGVLFCAFALQFARGLTTAAARRLFFVSVLYLPLLLGLMVLDKRAG